MLGAVEEGPDVVQEKSRHGEEARPSQEARVMGGK